MMQFFSFFFGFFFIFLFDSLELRFVKVIKDKGPLKDIITFYDHFKSYMFWYSENKHAILY